MIKYIDIYGLVDPRDGQVRYIGNTYDAKERMSNHICTAKIGRESKKNEWIRELLELNFRPSLKVLMSTTEDKRYELEMELIKHYRQFCPLTNSTDGGRGINGYVFSEKVKRERAEKSLKTRILNGDYEKVSKRMKGDGNPMKKHVKPVVQYNLNGTVVKEWTSASEAQKEIGYSRGNICLVCKGINKTAYGFIWKYKIIK